MSRFALSATSPGLGLHSGSTFAVLEFTVSGCWPEAANKNSLTESFVQAIDSVPADILQQVRVCIHRLRDRRLTQERLDGTPDML